MNEQVQRKTTIILEGPLVALVDRYIELQNKRIAPGKLSFNALVSAALVHYITKRDRNDSEEAA